MTAKPKRSRGTVLSGIEFVDGWVLVCPDDNHNAHGKTKWCIAWLEIFPTKIKALQFASENKWLPPFKAVHGSLSALQK